MGRRFKVKPIKKKSKKALDKVKDKLPTGEEEEPSSPRITNDTVAEHREEVLTGGRRFLYPLQHSKHRVVIISALLIGFLLISVFILTWLMLYRWQSTSNFAYRMTQIIPVPVAQVGDSWVPYEDYLFELNSSIYYYRNHAQEGVDIDSPEGEQIIAESKKQALKKAKLDTLALKIAAENNIIVSEEEINAKIAEIQNSGGIGEADAVLDDVLSDFYNWDQNDLRKVVELQLIRQKIPIVLDTETEDRANEVLNKLKNGGKFGELAGEHSDDNLTKENNGLIGPITRSDTDKLPKEFIDAAFNLEPGEISEEVVETPFGIHIIKVHEKDGEQIEVGHILFRYFNVNKFLNEQLNSSESKDYITLE